MELNWSLDVLYKGFEDERFIQDKKEMEALLADLAPALEEAKTLPAAEGLTCMLTMLEQLYYLEASLFRYCYLGQAVNSSDAKIASMIAQLSRLDASAAAVQADIEAFIAGIPDLENVTLSDPFLAEYRFYCLEIKKNASHKLSSEGETIFRKMQLSGGDSWSRLFDYLTSSVKVSYRDKELTLSEVRNLAYSADASVREDAYHAELAAYDQIKDSVAFALNSIKNEANTIAELRGYESPLARTLDQSRMTKATLDAMFEAMKRGLPIFGRYMKAKAKLLGREKLRFCDLFAPVGKSERTFTPEQAGDYLVEAFSAFCSDSADMIGQAFAENWIDFMPKKGKVGGAFCESLPGYDQSRILTNFSGDYESVNTLAHELGHAFHNRMTEGHRIMNQDYPMPIAETASTFNETHLAYYSLGRAADSGERLAILESLLLGSNQVICDIYSRFLFEDEVMKRSQSEFLMPDTLCDIMLRAQKEAYGDGLDPEFLHPYMWCCKGHYYSAELSYYNFPYAFGAMLAMGLYSMFRKDGADFVPRYEELLAATPVHSLEEIGELAGIDLTKVDFWNASIDAFEKLIEEYESLVEQMLAE